MLTLPPDVMEALQAECARTGESVDEMLAFLVRSYLAHPQGRRRVFQTAPVNALAQGLYEQNTTVAELKHCGDFGLGTFNDLDGELVMVNGQVFRADANGHCRIMPDDTKTPFATVTFFRPDLTEPVRAGDFEGRFLDLLEKMVMSDNMLYAIRVEGTFARVRCRSVPKQELYRPLVEVTRQQQEFEWEEQSGVLVGFHVPDFMASLNVPGYHLHFLSDDRTHGGHLLDCDIRSVTVAMQHVPTLELDLPMTLDYLTAELATDIRKDLEEAER